MIWSSIIVIKFILILNILFLFYLNYLLLIQYLIFLKIFNITPYIIFIYIITSYIIINILKKYQHLNQLFYKSDYHIKINFTVKSVLKNQLVSWWNRVLFYSKKDNNKLFFLNYFLRFYSEYLTLTHLYMFLLNFFINMICLPLKLISYIIFFLILTYKYLKWVIYIKDEDMLSMDEYSVILSYTPINVDSLIELFDEYNNLNWDYTEEFSSENFIKYILVTYTQWNDEDDIIDIF